MKIDVLAIAVHPDDAELSCVGTLLVQKKLGQKIGIIDLTQGELGSRGTATTRNKESEMASKILDLDVRENLKFRDGFFENNEEHQLKLIAAIRKYQPTIVLANAIRDRHPDHGRSSQLIKDACFLSGLIKIKTEFEGENQAPWRPKKVFYYIQDYYIEPDFIVDISAEMPKKLESIKAYGTQFSSGNNDEPTTYISTNEYLDTVIFRNRMMGKKIGAEYGEGFVLAESHLGLKNFDSLFIPEFS